MDPDQTASSGSALIAIKLAPDKRVSGKHFLSYFSVKTYVVGTKGPSETLLMHTHNIGFHGEKEYQYIVLFDSYDIHHQAFLTHFYTLPHDSGGVLWYLFFCITLIVGLFVTYSHPYFCFQTIT